MSGTTGPRRAKQSGAPAAYRTLHDQLEAGALDNALKTCCKLLRLDPSNDLASRTRIQVLIALDRYADALALVDPSPNLPRAYCLYKTGRALEAQRVLDDLQEFDDRAASVLQAQVHYRLERFENARDAFEDLIASLDEDSPERIDLENNLAACSSHLDFLNAVPSHLANLGAPQLDKLETAPVAPLVHAMSHSRPVLTGAIATRSSAPSSTVVKKPRHRRPQHLIEGSSPADDRWVPKRERAGAAETIVRKREAKRGKNKERLMTQGAADPPASGGGAAGGPSAKKPSPTGGKKKKKDKR